LLHSLVLILATIGWIWALSFAALGQSCASGAHGRDVSSTPAGGAAAGTCRLERAAGSDSATSQPVCPSVTR
jgi:hypothetical protein